MRVFLFGKKLEANNTRHVLKEAIRCYWRSGLSQTRISTQGSCDASCGKKMAICERYQDIVYEVHCCPVGFHSLDAWVTVYYRSNTSQLSPWSQTRKRRRERPAFFIAMVIKWHSQLQANSSASLSSVFVRLAMLLNYAQSICFFLYVHFISVTPSSMLQVDYSVPS